MSSGGLARGQGARGWGPPAAADAAQETALPDTGRWIDPFGGAGE
jgi:hypothetical protein